MSQIVIYFDPFKIFFSEAVNDGSMNGTNIIGIDVPWCSMPDLLIDELKNEIVGFSFSIACEYEINVVNFIEEKSNDKLKYISNSDPKFNKMYEGFGFNSRLELYLTIPKTRITCEYASLDSDSWLYDYDDRKLLQTNMPLGFVLDSIEDIEDMFGMRFSVID